MKSIPGHSLSKSAPIANQLKPKARGFKTNLSFMSKNWKMFKNKLVQNHWFYAAFIGHSIR